MALHVNQIRALRLGGTPGSFDRAIEQGKKRYRNMANKKTEVEMFDSHLKSLNDSHKVLDFGVIWKTTPDRHCPKGADKLKLFIRQFADYASEHPNIVFYVKMDSDINDFPVGYMFWIFDYAYHVRNIKLPEKFTKIIAKNDTYPWEAVQAHMNNRIPSIPGHLPCQLCGKPSEDLIWIDFSTSKKSWEMLAGRRGPMSICPDCHHQVEFICLLTN